MEFEKNLDNLKTLVDNFFKEMDKVSKSEKKQVQGNTKSMIDKVANMTDHEKTSLSSREKVVIGSCLFDELKKIANNIREEYEITEFWIDGVKFGEDGGRYFYFIPPDDVEEISKEYYEEAKKAYLAKKSK